MKSYFKRMIGSAAAIAVAFAMVGTANAADLKPIYTKAPAPVAAYNWTGCYIGAEGGGNWGRSQHYFENPNNPNLVGLAQTNGIDLSGALVGATVGCNYQITNGFVVGIENDISWTNKRGTSVEIQPFNTSNSIQTSEKWIDTLRARAGFALDRWFFYGTGGAAFANEGFVICDPATGCAGQSKTVTGWTAGAGLEYAVVDNWTLKVEYLHVDLGRQSYARTLSPTPGVQFAPRDVTLTDDMVRVGVNYKFGWGGPVVARY